MSAAAALALAVGAEAQPSHMCEFALAGWLGTRVELEEARTADRACSAARTKACASEQARVQRLEERCRLLRNSLDRYCRR